LGCAVIRQAPRRSIAAGACAGASEGGCGLSAGEDEGECERQRERQRDECKSWADSPRRMWGETCGLIGAGAGLMVPMGSSHKLRQWARDEFAVCSRAALVGEDRQGNGGCGVLGR
jgi:hypothetical protein